MFSAVKSKKIKRSCRCDACHFSVKQLLRQKAELSDRFATVETRARYPLSAHHFNYYKPLNVWWLCDYCHVVLHKAQQHFGYACIKLDAAASTIHNYTNWRSKGGREDYIYNEEKWVQAELKALESKRQKLLNYLERIQGSTSASL